MKPWQIQARMYSKPSLKQRRRSNSNQIGADSDSSEEEQNRVHRRRGNSCFWLYLISDLVRMRCALKTLKPDSRSMRKMISKHVFIFENGGSLNSDAAAPPPATAPEEAISPEGMKV
jgi:hypothetical protein